MKKKIGLFQAMALSDDEVFGHAKTPIASRWSVENRPYFMELPEGWEKHEHMNVVPYEEFIAGQGYTPQEIALQEIPSKLEKTGYFTITPQKPKEKPTVTFNFPLTKKNGKAEPIIHFPDNEEEDE